MTALALKNDPLGHGKHVDCPSRRLKISGFAVETILYFISEEECPRRAKDTLGLFAPYGSLNTDKRSLEFFGSSLMPHGVHSVLPSAAATSPS